MKKTHLLQKIKRTLATVTASVLLIATVAVPAVQAFFPGKTASGFDAGYINKLNNIGTNYDKYIDNSVMFRLPDNIAADQDISVIITVGEPALLDAYQNTDKAYNCTKCTAHHCGPDKR